MGVMTGQNTAGVDKEVATQALNRELQDKGFLLTSTEDIINWARTGSLHWMTFGLKVKYRKGCFLCFKALLSCFLESFNSVSSMLRAYFVLSMHSS